jgi:acetylglutamate kinase
MTRVINDGSASAGMIAKLLACREALRNGVGTVTIINGKNARRGLFERVVRGTVLTQ